MLGLANLKKFNVQRLLGIARREAVTGNWANAAQLYQKILDDHPENIPAWVQYGHALKESGNLRSAESAYRVALSLKPILADTHLQLGHVLKLQGRVDEAVAAYAQAHSLAPYLRQAEIELIALDQAPRRAVRLSDRDEARAVEARRHGDEAASLVFDVTDLLSYFEHSRLPTGIQRVQISVLSSLLRREVPGVSVALACFVDRRDFWVSVPADLFLEVLDLAVSGGDVDHPVWKDARAELTYRIDNGPDVEFVPGATLVSLGTSWWVTNYFLVLRQARARYGIRYVPFIHDLVPVMVPEHCTKELTRDFINWITGAFFHADGCLVNSLATARDLGRVAEVLGHAIPPPAVIRLDARFASDPGVLFPAASNELRRFVTGREPFVLFVGTIESRKNHLLAFNAWLELIRKRGEKGTPTLVCVGGQGWLTEAAMARFEASPLLQRKVKMLSRISDADLSRLYRHCLFTLYPSSYEGWGLPVTESLCYGKVALTTAISALPEAGGEFAEYFAHQSVTDMIAKLERLIDDTRYRSAREAKIRDGFQARSWHEIGDEIVRGALSFSPGRRLDGDAAPAEPRTYLPAQPDRYYSLARNHETGIWPGMTNAEIYRMGTGWWAPDESGTWTKPGLAALGFALEGDEAGAAYIVYLGLRGQPLGGTGYTVRFGGPGSGERTGRLRPGETRWIILKLSGEVQRRGHVRIELETDDRADPKAAVDGADQRRFGIGVIGFYICREADPLARLRFVEALQLGGPEELDGRPEDGSRYVPIAE
ncbi:MAG TPA: glycosyltransferase [Stellaceae bacterium]|jgi:glycosyltransferase involved in cell wall biosynthesis|nr:glycosyltransferase [Stellaceae bacterium]